MQTVTTIGLDIAKSVFQVHGIDAEGNDISPSAEAPLCPSVLREAAAVPGWDRGLRHVASLVARAQAFGHNALMPPAYVKPYVKRQKNDAADAEAICEAVTRANMRFVDDQDARAAELPDAPSHTPALRPPVGGRARNQPENGSAAREGWGDAPPQSENPDVFRALARRSMAWPAECRASSQRIGSAERDRRPVPAVSITPSASVPVATIASARSGTPRRNTKSGWLRRAR